MVYLLCVTPLAEPLLMQALSNISTSASKEHSLRQALTKMKEVCGIDPMLVCTMADA